MEAESVALICCESLGLGGAEYLRGYIQHWMIRGEGIPEPRRIFVTLATSAILAHHAQEARHATGQAGRPKDPAPAPGLFKIEGMTFEEAVNKATLKKKPPGG